MDMEQPATVRKPNGPIRLVRVIAISMGLMLLILGVQQVENQRGEQAWKRLQAEYASKGQPLDFESWKKLHGAAALDGSNFFGTPLLKPLFDFVVVHDRSGVASEAWLHASDFERVRNIRLPRPLREGDLYTGVGVSLEFWQSVFRSEPRYSLPSGVNPPAKDVLSALEMWDNELSELEIASRRPVGRMPLIDRTVLGLVQPCAVLRRVSEILQLRCAARLELGDAEGALRDIEFNERLGNMLASDEREFCHLSGEEILALGARMVWDGMRRHQWDQAQLGCIDKILATRQPRQAWLNSLAFQRMDQCRDLQSKHAHLSSEVRESFEAFAGDVARQATMTVLNTWHLIEGRQSLRRYTHNLNEQAAASLWKAGNLAVTAAIACTPGWSLQNIVNSVREFEPRGRLLEAWVRSQALYGEVARSELSQPRTWWSVYRSPGFSPAAPMTVSLQCTADTESMTRMARVACAIERYRLVNKAVPKDLNQLVPGFLAEIPHDTFTDKDFIYVPLSVMSYVLDSPYRPEGREKRFTHWLMPDESDIWLMGSMLG